MEQAISFLMALLLATASYVLVRIGRSMARGTLHPNSSVGIRTRAANRSTDDWYRIQRRGSTAVIGLGVAWGNCAILYVIQGAYPCIPLTVPAAIFTVQSIIGIAVIHLCVREPHTSQE